MNSSAVLQTELAGNLTRLANKRSLLLRLIRAAQPITRTEIATRLEIDKSTVTDNVKPLIDAGILREDTLDSGGHGRKPRVLSFAGDRDYFIGVNLGVRRSQVGITTLTGEISDELDFETPKDVNAALDMVKDRIENIIAANPGNELKTIGVSVPGMTDTDRSALIYAPNLDWRSVRVSDALQIEGVPIVVENDSTAAAMYEARMKIRHSSEGLMTNFILVRSGTGIGVGLVIGSEVYRGSGLTRGIAGAFGHMTIVAGGRQFVCGNRCCCAKYASAAAAASLHPGDRPIRRA